MTRIPFPFNFAVGTDICQISRVREIVLRGKTQSFVHKFLNQTEIEWLSKKVPDWRMESRRGSKNDILVNYLAGRWAAKEAARKAIGARYLRQTGVTVSVREDGRPEVLYPVWDEERKQSEKVGLCSISHDGTHAVASVVAVPYSLNDLKWLPDLRKEEVGLHEREDVMSELEADDYHGEKNESIQMGDEAGDGIWEAVSEGQIAAEDKKYKEE